MDSIMELKKIVCIIEITVFVFNLNINRQIKKL
jgi:hypothetical protein